MKKRSHLPVYLLLFIVGLGLFSCKKESEEIAPTITLAQETLVVFKGGSDTIRATISHPVGVKSINLSQAAFNLDRTINLDSPYPTEYDLVYAFNIPSSLDESSYDITISAVGSDNGTSSEILVAEISDVVNFYLLANNVTVDGATAVCHILMMSGGMYP